jgi:hypothetical protein
MNKEIYKQNCVRVLNSNIQIELSYFVSCLRSTYKLILIYCQNI